MKFSGLFFSRHPVEKLAVVVDFRRLRRYGRFNGPGRSEGGGRERGRGQCRSRKWERTRPGIGVGEQL